MGRVIGGHFSGDTSVCIRPTPLCPPSKAGYPGIAYLDLVRFQKTVWAGPGMHLIGGTWEPCLHTQLRVP